jgi:hypothetical protein
MNKKTVILIVVVALLAVGAFTMGQRRAAMMRGETTGAGLPLAAVSTDGKPIPLAADVEKVTGKLADGSAAQKVGDMIVVFSMNPYPATMRQTTNFAVLLKDSKGQAINDATVTLNLTMPEMWMPPNSPALDFISDGKYQAAGQFTMRGWWRIEVVITHGGQTQSAFFDVGL